MRKLLSTIVLGYLSLLCFPPALQGMTDPVTGIILDSKSREPLPFANIVVVGLNKGTVSNAEGRFAFDRSVIPPDDTVQFSYMGYETLRIRVAELKRKNRIRMDQASINLEEVQVSSKTMSAKEIVAMAERNFKKNHPSPSQKQEVFFHNYEKVPFTDSNQVRLKKSDFPGLDEVNLREIFELMPDEFIEYQDAVFHMYSHGKDNKLVPAEAISLEEGSMEALGREMEERMGELIEDIQNTREDQDVYYQIKSGILSHKFKGDDVSDSLWNEYQNDTLNYTLETSEIKKEVTTLFKDYTGPRGRNWEFLRDRGKYEYTREEVLIYEEEFVYRISFRPKDRGLYEGNMYISTEDYGIMQLDFAFAEGKQGEKFSLAGISYSMDFKKGRVIYQKSDSGYYLKYLKAVEHEWTSVDRKFKVMKRHRKGLRDPVLNEVEVEMQLVFDIEHTWELLVLGRDLIDPAAFEAAQEPLFMKFRKEYAYTPEMWADRTHIVPSTELSKYTRK